MPPRANPTARQGRLGAELRKLRERAGKAAREAGAFLGVDQAKISNIESGRIGVSEERIRRLAGFYACMDGELIDALCAMSYEHRGQFWWDEYRGVLPPAFLDLAELEHHARCLRSLQVVSIPGLLQTEEYARALFSSNAPRPPAEEVEARVEHRMRRKAIFERTQPPELTVLIHEAALRMRFGGRKVVKAQLNHLNQAADRPYVTLRVIPFTNEEFFEATQPVLYASGVVPALDTVQFDTPLGGSLLDAEAEVKRYRAHLDAAERAALDVESSRRMVREIAEGL